MSVGTRHGSSWAALAGVTLLSAAITANAQPGKGGAQQGSGIPGGGFLAGARTAGGGIGPQVAG
jgi:hypothetical protein